MSISGGPTGLLTALLAKRLGASVLVLGKSSRYDLSRDTHSRLFGPLCEAEISLISCRDR